SAFRVLAVVMNRGHQGAGLLANRAHHVADLGCFRVVVLVLHAEGGCNRVDDDFTEPHPKVALEPLVQRFQLPNEQPNAFNRREVRQRLNPGDGQLLDNRRLRQGGGETVRYERTPLGGDEDGPDALGDLVSEERQTLGEAYRLMHFDEGLASARLAAGYG